MLNLVKENNYLLFGDSPTCKVLVSEKNILDISNALIRYTNYTCDEDFMETKTAENLRTKFERKWRLNKFLMQAANEQCAYGDFYITSTMEKHIYMRYMETSDSGIFRFDLQGIRDEVVNIFDLDIKNVDDLIVEIITEINKGGDT